MIDGREPGAHLLEVGFFQKADSEMEINVMLIIKCSGYQQLWKRRKGNRIRMEQREKSNCGSVLVKHLSQPYGTF